MSADFAYSLLPPNLGAAHSTLGTLGLDSAYTYGSAGDAVVMRFALQQSQTLTDIYAYLLAKTGSPDSLNWELRDVEATYARKPGPTLIASGTYNPSADTPPCWVHIASGLSAGLEAQRLYCAVLADANGSPTNYVTVPNRIYGTTQPVGQMIGGSWTTGGFVAHPDYYDPSGMVLKLSAGLSLGGPYVIISDSATLDVERGLKFSLTAPLTFCAVGWVSGSTLISGVKLYQDLVPPGGLTLYTGTPQAQTGQTLGFHAFANGPLRLDAGTYRLVLSVSSATGLAPRWMTMGTTPPADVQAAGYAQSSDWCWTQADGAAWSDDATKLPRMMLFVQDLVATESGIYPVRAADASTRALSRDATILPVTRDRTVHPRAWTTVGSCQ